MGKVNLINGAK